MKKISNYIFLGILSLFFVSCGKEYSHLNIVTQVDGGARLKVFHMVPDQTGATMKVDNKQVSGVLTTTGLPGLVGYGSLFPLAEYFTVEPGSRNLLVSFLNADRTASVDVTSSLNMSANKFYSAYVVGQAGTHSVVLGEDDIPKTEADKTHIRIINTVTNTPAVGYEVLINNVVVDTKTAVLDGKEKFVGYPQDGAARFTIVVRQKGTTTALSTLSAQNLVRGKAYTILIRGINGNTTTAQRVTAAIVSNN
ncbi:MAG TPA: DUF4397 domain-containing protein [Saprospiraceae bacterium]|nr:DUF4397 domain-containing protein [Saprospiraceae bacterium]